MLSKRAINILLSLLIMVPVLFTCCAGHMAGGAVTKENARAMQNMGLALVQQGDLRGGLEHLLNAVELDPGNPDLYHELALVYRDLNQYDLSLQYFEKALRLKPEFPEARNNLGTLYLMTGKWDKAIESFQAAVDDLMYKTPHIAYNNMGFAYYNKGWYEKAIESYRMSLREFPGYVACHVNLGIAYEAINRVNKAISAYNKSILYDPEYVPAYYRLGKLYYEIGERNNALDALKKFVLLAEEGPVKEEAMNLVRTLENKTNLP